MAAWIEPKEDEIAAIVRSARFVAVVGMKDEQDPAAPAYTVPARMRELGIRTIGVNPKLAGALSTLKQLKEAPDVIQVFRRSDSIGPLADEIIAMPQATRPKVVWLQSGIVNVSAAMKLETAGMRVVMDRCFAVELAKHGAPVVPANP